MKTHIQPQSTITINQNALMTEHQAAEFLSYNPRTLQAWRLKGEGPPFLKIGKKSVRYIVKDLIEWAESCRKSSTSEISAARFD